MCSVCSLEHRDAQKAMRHCIWGHDVAVLPRIGYLLPALLPPLHGEACRHICTELSSAAGCLRARRGHQSDATDQVQRYLRCPHVSRGMRLLSYELPTLI